jgi:hypothetical protein
MLTRLLCGRTLAVKNLEKIDEKKNNSEEKEKKRCNTLEPNY